MPLASRLMQTLNLNADPCDDFYEYACGNFKFMRPLGSKDMTSNTDEVSDFIDARVKGQASFKKKLYNRIQRRLYNWMNESCLPEIVYKQLL